MAVGFGTVGDGDHGGSGGTGRKLECWRYGGEHMKRYCLKRAEEKESKQNYGEGVDNKRVEVTGGQLHTMFTSSVDVPSGTDFSELGEDDELGTQEFEGHAPLAMHNATGRVVPLTWILLDSQSTVDLIANPIMLLNIRKVRSEEAIHVHYNSGVKVVDRVGDLPGYRNVWYEPTGIASSLSM